MIVRSGHGPCRVDGPGVPTRDETDPRGRPWTTMPSTSITIPPSAPVTTPRPDRHGPGLRDDRRAACRAWWIARTRRHHVPLLLDRLSNQIRGRSRAIPRPGHSRRIAPRNTNSRPNRLRRIRPPRRHPWSRSAGLHSHRAHPARPRRRWTRSAGCSLIQRHRVGVPPSTTAPRTISAQPAAAPGSRRIPNRSLAPGYRPGAGAMHEHGQGQAAPKPATRPIGTNITPARCARRSRRRRPSPALRAGWPWSRPWAAPQLR